MISFSFHLSKAEEITVTRESFTKEMSLHQGLENKISERENKPHEQTDRSMGYERHHIQNTWYSGKYTFPQSWFPSVWKELNSLVFWPLSALLLTMPQGTLYPYIPNDWVSTPWRQSRNTQWIELKKYEEMQNRKPDNRNIT